MLKKVLLSGFMLVAGLQASAQEKWLLLKPQQVFDGENLQSNWQVLVHNQRIEAVGVALKIPANTEIIDLPNCTLLPGLIEGILISATPLQRGYMG
jgi:imidazolonepropionase-like amidohydrolase